MNCRRVQKLIPLHVEGDLHTSVANRVELHLEWCGRCNWLSDEYKESQRWLRTSPPPEFDEAILENLKSAVMKRVAENNAMPSLFASLAQRWSRRQMLALAATFVIVLGMVGLYLYRTRAKSNLQVISEVVEQPPGSERKPSDDLLPVTAAGEHPGATSNKRHLASNRRRTFRSPAGHSSVAAASARRTLVSQSGGTQANAASDQSGVPSGAANRPGDLLRIEIQTGDPSIRIIWFAPKETDLHQSKPATD